MTSSILHRVSTKYNSCAFLTRSSSSRLRRFFGSSSSPAPFSSTGYFFGFHSILSTLRVR